MTDQLLRQLFTTSEQIDDVARARIWSKLAGRLDEPVAHRRWLPVAGALAFVAAAAILLVVTRRGDNEQRLGAPQGTVLTTTLGPHAHAALEGPAMLAVAQTGDVTRARLEEGTLYAEFTGGPGRALHITAAGAEIEVVGTLFAVEVHGARVCLSVAHGRVRMIAGGAERMVAGGERACAQEGAFIDATAIATATRDALMRHARTWAPDAPALDGMAPEAAAPRAADPALPASPPPPPPASLAPPRPDPQSPVRAPLSASPPATPPAARSSSDVAAMPAPAATAPTSAPAAAASPETATATTVASSPVAPSTDAALYRDADAALARGDRDAADRALAKLLAISPQSPLADEALYERARIAVERRAWSDARGMLARLAKISDTPLAEPGAYLRCRIAVTSGEHGASDVLAAYVAEYPDGPHDLEVRLQLVGTQYREGGCSAAAAQLDELELRHPDDAGVSAYRTRCGGGR